MENKNGLSSLVKGLIGMLFRALGLALALGLKILSMLFGKVAEMLEKVILKQKH